MAYETITTFDGDGSFNAYVARPAGAAKAAIIVIQEIFGVNPGIRKKCDDWAAKGYLAVAPDMFWRTEAGVELDADVQAEFQKGVDLMMKMDQDLAVRDLEAAIRFARDATGGGKVGMVGFCMGGRLAFMSACRTDGDAFVGYYGVGIDNLIGESHAIGKPVLLHVPTADGFVGPEAQKAMHDGLDANPHVTIIDYPGLDHGFAAEHGKRRDEAAAARADGATAEFFAAHL